MIFDILSGIRSSNALCTPCFTSSECCQECWDADRSEPNASATAESLASPDDLAEANASVTAENVAGVGAEAPGISVSAAPEANASATAESLASLNDLAEANASSTAENVAGVGAEAPGISVSAAPEANASATAESLASPDDLAEANASATAENVAGVGAEAPSISVSGAPEASATAEIAVILQATHDPAGFGSTRIKMVKGLHPTTWQDNARTVSSFDMFDIHCRCFNITILY
jgi:hypothetical protein